MSDEPGVGAQDISDLRAAIADLQRGQEELRAAATPVEKQEAREDIREAKADLDKLASDLGISRSALEHAATEARKAERKEELRPILAELLDELADDDGDEKETPEGEAKPAPAPPPPKREPKAAKDTEPVVEHWSERRVAEMLK